MKDFACGVTTNIAFKDYCRPHNHSIQTTDEACLKPLTPFITVKDSTHVEFMATCQLERFFFSPMSQSKSQQPKRNDLLTRGSFQEVFFRAHFKMSEISQRHRCKQNFCYNVRERKLYTYVKQA